MLFKAQEETSPLPDTRDFWFYQLDIRGDDAHQYILLQHCGHYNGV
jgi:hypothetical protein